MNCNFYEEERSGYEYGNYIERQSCSLRPRLENLQSFPFKKEQSCFVPDFWTTEFAVEVNAKDVDDFLDACEEPMRKWREKYFNSEVLSLLTTPKRPSPREIAEEYAKTIAPALQTDYHREKHAESWLAGHEAAMKEAEILVEALEKIESLDLADGYAARDALARYRGGQS